MLGKYSQRPIKEGREILFTTLCFSANGLVRQINFLEETVTKEHTSMSPIVPVSCLEYEILGSDISKQKGNIFL